MSISNDHINAIGVAIIIQIFVGFLGITALDGGALRQLCTMALWPYWIATVILIWRRPMTPTSVDLSFIRIGYLLVLVATLFIAPLIWRLRGVLGR